MELDAHMVVRELPLHLQGTVESYQLDHQRTKLHDRRGHQASLHTPPPPSPLPPPLLLLLLLLPPLLRLQRRQWRENLPLLRHLLYFLCLYRFPLPPLMLPPAAPATTTITTLKARLL